MKGRYVFMKKIVTLLTACFGIALFVILPGFSASAGDLKLNVVVRNMVISSNGESDNVAGSGALYYSSDCGFEDPSSYVHFVNYTDDVWLAEEGVGIKAGSSFKDISFKASNKGDIPTSFNARLVYDGEKELTLWLTDENGYYYAVWDDNMVFYYVDSEESDGNQFVEQYYEEISDTCDDIVKAAQGINRDGSENSFNLVVYDAKGALNYKIVNAAVANPTANVFVDYEYEGIRFRSALVPSIAAQFVEKDIPWYGPCFLASNFPTMILGTVE